MPRMWPSTLCGLVKSPGAVYAAQPISLIESTATMVADPQYLIERVRDKSHVSRFLLQAS